MSLTVLSLLSATEVQALVDGLKECAFVDGRVTARSVPKETKDNLQIDRSTSSTPQLDALFLSALARSAEFQAFAFPKRIQAPIYSKYEPGMHYGPHTDRAIMGGGPNEPGLRTDYSMTLFLAPPSSYDGGELVIDTGWGNEEIKLNPGEAVIYPSTTIHHVAPVTRGVRLAVVTWIQSRIRDAALREIIRDLGNVHQMAATLNNSPLQLLLGKSYNNLLRYASEL